MTHQEVSDLVNNTQYLMDDKYEETGKVIIGFAGTNLDTGNIHIAKDDEKYFKERGAV